MPLCEDCVHFRCMVGQCRGVMDCDPDEWYCNADCDDFFYDGGSYVDEETGEETECPKYKYADRDDYYGY